MGDLTAHFSSHEFVCRDGSAHAIDCRLLAMLEAARCRFGPISITSGYRSASYNQRVGGARDSYHVKGMAADIKCAHASDDDLYRWLDEMFPISGLGIYIRDGDAGWVHLDCRAYRARWSG